MARSYTGNDLEWKVLMSGKESRPGMVPIVFHCTSNTSFGWRVAEVPADEYGDRRPEDLTDAELDEVFAQAQPFGAPRDPKAHEDAIGHTPTR